jgi:hypothetical protein
MAMMIAEFYDALVKADDASARSAVVAAAECDPRPADVARRLRRIRRGHC